MLVQGKGFGLGDVFMFALDLVLGWFNIKGPVWFSN